MKEATKLAAEFRVVLAQDNAGFVCRVPEFPGLVARGATPAESEQEGREALIALIASLLADGMEAPKPRHVYASRAQVNFRLLPDDLYVLESAAASMGQSVGEFVREHALTAARSLIG